MMSLMRLFLWLITFPSSVWSVIGFHEKYPICGKDELSFELMGLTSEQSCSVMCTARSCSYYKYEGNECSIGDGGGQTAIQNGKWLMATYVRKEFTTSAMKNVALGKTTDASSIYGTGNEDEAAVDGSYTSYFHSHGEHMPWWMVDLGQSCLVKKIIISARSAWASRVGSLKIYVSDTYSKSSDYSALPLFAEQVGNPPTASNVYEVPNFTCGRYVVVQKQNTDILEFYEVEVHAIPL